MNEVVITIAVILFPGFLATLIVADVLNASPKWTSFRYWYLFLYFWGFILYDTSVGRMVYRESFRVSY